MNDSSSQIRESGSVRFSLRTLLLTLGVAAVVLATLGRMALGLTSWDELRQLALVASFLALVAFLLVAASYSGSSDRDKTVAQFLYGLVGVLAGMLIGPMLCWALYRPEGHPLLWAPLGAIIGGLFVIVAVRFLWWYRDHLTPRWWIVGLVTLLLMPAIFVTIRDWNHPQETAIAELRKLGVHVHRSDFTGNALGVSFSKETQNTDDALKRLKELTSLRYVSFVDGGNEVTDAGLAHLKGLVNLRGLRLSGSQVTDAGLEHLKGLSNLRWLTLSHSSQVGDAGLEHLQGLDKLIRLELVNTQVTDAGLEHLRGLRNLRSLNLSRTKVSDAGLKHLEILVGLKQLVLRGIDVTQAGVQHLRKELPNCNVFH